MKFTWKTKDGKIHTKDLSKYANRVLFIEYLVFSPDVIWWEVFR